MIIYKATNVPEWTTTPPTEPGWYLGWPASRYVQEPYLHHVVKMLGSLLRVENPDVGGLDPLPDYAYWLGPLPNPLDKALA